MSFVLDSISLSPSPVTTLKRVRPRHRNDAWPRCRGFWSVWIRRRAPFITSLSPCNVDGWRELSRYCLVASLGIWPCFLLNMRDRLTLCLLRPRIEEPERQNKCWTKPSWLPLAPPVTEVCYAECKSVFPFGKFLTTDLICLCT
jgi:hypothetical protein